jgi:2-amino-4-hydroxy-6-hydroxymethyldihydropteridine diphosphokinase
MSSGSRTATAAADGAVVFLGLGANVGDRDANLRAARVRISAFVDVDATSDVYETEPFGLTDQPRFLNMVVRGRTALDPHELLDAMKDVERQLGRTRTVRMGPRIIDIDLLLYGGLTLEEEGLVVPHPGILERAFVLQPLLDIDPDLRHPVTGELLRDALAELAADARTMRRLGPAAAPSAERSERYDAHG